VSINDLAQVHFFLLFLGYLVSDEIVQSGYAQASPAFVVIRVVVGNMKEVIAVVKDPYAGQVFCIIRHC
jgi:mannose/fructose/N-acetylgalactosamine-specific phosphotransferase system component IIB